MCSIHNIQYYLTHHRGLLGLWPAHFPGGAQSNKELPNHKNYNHHVSWLLRDTFSFEHFVFITIEEGKIKEMFKEKNWN